jgi:hypothetical protein
LQDLQDLLAKNRGERIGARGVWMKTVAIEKILSI